MKTSKETKRTILVPILILFLIASLLFISCSCKFPQLSKLIKLGKGEKDYICKDGAVVKNMSDCPELQNPAENKTEKPATKINITKELNETLLNESERRNFSTLRKKFTNVTNQTGELPNLNGWSVPEIVNGMAAYNLKFMGLVSAPVSYDRYNQSIYYIGNSGKKSYDPFNIARAPYHGNAQEYQINGFRIYLTQTPYEFLEMVDGKQKDSKFKLLYSDQWTEWDLIKCKKINSCRNIEAIECTNGIHALYMWAHTTPGEAYTETTKYNMQAVDDDRETLTTFEQFYCTPV